MTKVLESIEESGQYFAEHAEEADELGRLSDETVRRIRDTGLVRMLQPRDFDGFEMHPAEFYEAAMALAAHSPSAGWVGGIVGIHAFELASADRRAQEEIWGEDPEAWVVSPYAPFGRARPVGGGFRFSGRWPFSSGTDHAGWAILGGMVTDEDGEVGTPPDIRHVIVRRSDYEIVEDSWDVVGLRGTGSKDVIVDDAFVPAHRVLSQQRVFEGDQGREARPDNPMYALPFATIFGGVIAAATIGMAEGALAASIEHTRTRVSHIMGDVSLDPHQLSALGEASADIQASKVHFLDDIRRGYDHVMAGGTVWQSMRLEARRNQVRASRRAVDAVDTLFRHAGGGALHLRKPQQRFWRDTHAAMSHLCNVADPIYGGYGTDLFGKPVPPGVFH